MITISKIENNKIPHIWVALFRTMYCRHCGTIFNSNNDYTIESCIGPKPPDRTLLFDLNDDLALKELLDDLSCS